MLDTLVQNGTRLHSKKYQKPIIVSGTGSDLTNEKLINGRGKRKVISQTLALNLIKVAEAKEDVTLVNSLWNTYYCQEKVYSSNDRLFGNYCKNRFCTVCQGIRKAEIINKYLPVIKQWEDPFFVTLTVKAQPAKNLKKWIGEGMIRGLNQIIAKHKKRNQRGKGIKLIGIRSLECNFNPDKRTYNPHFHIIVPNKETAELLIEEWLKLWTRKHTHRDAQDYRPLKDLEADLVETIKYGTKIFTEPDVRNKNKKKLPRHIYIKAMYNILSAMKGHRIFERFGFNLPASEKKISEPLELDQYEEWNYNPQFQDWENSDNLQKLTNYLPTNELLNLLLNNINTELE